MRLGLLGYPILHSKSPEIYRRLLGSSLISYDLFSVDDPKNLPPLEFFQRRLDGLNITSPYKRHFFKKVVVDSHLAQKVGAINTLFFQEDEVFGENTDILAVKEILKNYTKKYPHIFLILLGDGVMAELTKVVAEFLKLPLLQFSRQLNGDLTGLDLSSYSIKKNYQTIIINSCSRDFIFKGKLAGNEIFWDYNYSFSPHASNIPSMAKSYEDGQLMLEIQAKEAIRFWQNFKPKL